MGVRVAVAQLPQCSISLPPAAVCSLVQITNGPMRLCSEVEFIESNGGAKGESEENNTMLKGLMQLQQGVRCALWPQ